METIFENNFIDNDYANAYATEVGSFRHGDYLIAWDDRWPKRYTKVT